MAAIRRVRDAHYLPEFCAKLLNYQQIIGASGIWVHLNSFDVFTKVNVSINRVEADHNDLDGIVVELALTGNIYATVRNSVAFANGKVGFAGVTGGVFMQVIGSTAASNGIGNRRMSGGNRRRAIQPNWKPHDLERFGL